jgi:hypothetical protein
LLIILAVHSPAILLLLRLTFLYFSINTSSF